MQLRPIPLVILTLCLGSQLCRAAKCTYSLSPGSVALGPEAVASNVLVSTTVACAWSATTTNAWIHVSAAGSGSASVTFTVDANPTPGSRTGYIKLETEVLTVSQSGSLPSIGTALDEAGVTWQTSPEYAWFPTTNPTYDGATAVASGNRYVNNSVSWLQTEVVGPGRISFWWKVDSDVSQVPPDPPYSYDSLQFLMNDEVADEIMGQVDWNYRAYEVPVGTNILRWQYVKDAQYHLGADRGWVDQVSYTTNSLLPLAKALNTRGVFWNCGGNTNPTRWAPQTAVTHDGVSALRSGAITGGQESWVETTVTGATNVSFWWKVSSEASYDWLEFYINGALANRISGETAWEANSYMLSLPTNTLTWRYFKNTVDYFAKGQDCGWLDEVVISPAPKILPLTIESLQVLPEGRAELTVQGEAGALCTIEASGNLATWTGLTNIVLPGTPTVVTDLDLAFGLSRFYRATIE